MSPRSGLSWEAGLSNQGPKDKPPFLATPMATPPLVASRREIRSCAALKALELVKAA